MNYCSTPSGLELSLAHNPELALGANHIQALGLVWIACLYWVENPSNELLSEKRLK